MLEGFTLQETWPQRGNLKQSTPFLCSRHISQKNVDSLNRFNSPCCVNRNMSSNTSFDTCNVSRSKTTFARSESSSIIVNRQISSVQSDFISSAITASFSADSQEHRNEISGGVNSGYFESVENSNWRSGRNRAFSSRSLETIGISESSSTGMNSDPESLSSLRTSSS